MGAISFAVGLLTYWSGRWGLAKLRSPRLARSGLTLHVLDKPFVRRRHLLSHVQDKATLASNRSMSTAARNSGLSQLQTCFTPSHARSSWSVQLEPCREESRPFGASR